MLQFQAVKLITAAERSPGRALQVLLSDSASLSRILATDVYLHVSE